MNVIADDAHRSHHDFIDAFARHMRDALPQASFYYEGRLAKLKLNEAERPKSTLWKWPIQRNGQWIAVGVPWAHRRRGARG